MNQNSSAQSRAVADVRRTILERRRRELAAEWQQIQDDVAHWNRMHPDEPPIVMEPITAQEIQALKKSAAEPPEQSALPEDGLFA